MPRRLRLRLGLHVLHGRLRRTVLRGAVERSGQRGLGHRLRRCTGPAGAVVRRTLSERARLAIVGAGSGLNSGAADGPISGYAPVR